MKNIGYVMAPFCIEDGSLRALTIYSREELKKFKRGEMADAYVSQLKVIGRRVITYSVFEDGDGTKIYRPVSLYQRGKRFCAKKFR